MKFESTSLFFPPEKFDKTFLIISLPVFLIFP